MAIKEVEKEHSSENIARYLLKVIKDYEIKKNLGYIIIDNALDNNTIIIHDNNTYISFGFFDLNINIFYYEKKMALFIQAYV